MATPFATRLNEACRQRRTIACVGIDPMVDRLPASLRDSHDSLAAINVFCRTVIDLSAGRVPMVKFQSAYFEIFRADGVALLDDLVHDARSKDLLTIVDAKRGDIGATSTAYAQAAMTLPDAVTINPMLGMDTLEPFIEFAHAHGKGLFVLVRTSNPGSGATQDVPLADGRTWSQMLADQLQKMIGAGAMTDGYSPVGAVVGATQTHTIDDLRRRLPNSIFLLPGYGMQGGTAADARHALDARGGGAIVNASRSVLYPAGGPDWRENVRLAIDALADDLAVHE